MLRASFIVCAIAFAPVAGCASATSAAGQSEQYRCANDRGFEVVRAGDVATVHYGNDRVHAFERQPGSIGQRYSSSSGTLIIDGDFAALVTNQDIGFRECRKAKL